MWSDDMPSFDVDYGLHNMKIIWIKIDHSKIIESEIANVVYVSRELIWL